MCADKNVYSFGGGTADGTYNLHTHYDYDAAKKDMVKRLGRKPEDFFLTRAMTRDKLAKILEWGRRLTVFGTPVYQEFLAEREEILKHKWIESEKAGRDIGFERALTDWIIKHRSKWRKSRQAAGRFSQVRIRCHQPVFIGIRSSSGTAAGSSRWRPPQRSGCCRFPAAGC